MKSIIVARILSINKDIKDCESIDISPEKCYNDASFVIVERT